jgi:hypothetical protein
MPQPAAYSDYLTALGAVGEALKNPAHSGGTVGDILRKLQQGQSELLVSSSALGGLVTALGDYAKALVCGSVEIAVDVTRKETVFGQRKVVTPQITDEEWARKTGMYTPLVDRASLLASCEPPAPGGNAVTIPIHLEVVSWNKDYQPYVPPQLTAEAKEKRARISAMVVDGESKEARLKAKLSLLRNKLGELRTHLKSTDTVDVPQWLANMAKGGCWEVLAEGRQWPKIEGYDYAALLEDTKTLAEALTGKPLFAECTVTINVEAIHELLNSYFAKHHAFYTAYTGSSKAHQVPKMPTSRSINGILRHYEAMGKRVQYIFEAVCGYDVEFARKGDKEDPNMSFAITHQDKISRKSHEQHANRSAASRRAHQTMRNKREAEAAAAAEAAPAAAAAPVLVLVESPESPPPSEQGPTGASTPSTDDDEWAEMAPSAPSADRKRKAEPQTDRSVYATIWNDAMDNGKQYSCSALAVLLEQSEIAVPSPKDHDLLLAGKPKETLCWQIHAYCKAIGLRSPWDDQTEINLAVFYDDGIAGYWDAISKAFGVDDPSAFFFKFAGASYVNVGEDAIKLVFDDSVVETPKPLSKRARFAEMTDKERALNGVNLVLLLVYKYDDTINATTLDYNAAVKKFAEIVATTNTIDIELNGAQFATLADMVKFFLRSTESPRMDVASEIFTGGDPKDGGDNWYRILTATGEEDPLKKSVMLRRKLVKTLEARKAEYKTDDIPNPKAAVVERWGPVDRWEPVTAEAEA